MRMKSLFFTFLFLISSISYAGDENKPLVVAVIDTGFGYEKQGEKDRHLCKEGHRDFTTAKKFMKNSTTKDPVPLDEHGHGTNIVGLIEDNAGDADYCIVVLKYYNPDAQTGFFHENNMKNTEMAITYAIAIGADYINYSGGGPEQSEEETKLIKKFLDRGGKVIAAAGNEKSDIDGKPSAYYPAMSDNRIIVVGNAKRITKEKYNSINEVNKEKKTIYVDNVLAYPSDSSNYGYRVNRWEYGENEMGYGITMTGTSQATAIATGKIIKENAK